MIPSLVFANCYESQMRQIKDPSISSYNQCAEANFLDSKTRKMFNDALKVANPDPNDKRLNPGLLTADEAKRMPPTTFGIAGYDPFRDEGLLYAKFLTEQGVPTDVHIFKGLPHGFRIMGNRLSASAEWDKVWLNGIQWALSKPNKAVDFMIKEH